MSGKLIKVGGLGMLLTFFCFFVFCFINSFGTDPYTLPPHLKQFGIICIWSFGVSTIVVLTGVAIKKQV